LRGDFKQSQYGRVILPFTILRRLECVLAARKPQVLAGMDLSPAAISSHDIFRFTITTASW
jgi:type I restriction enzyme M protein